MYSGHIYGVPASQALLAALLGYGCAMVAFAGLAITLTIRREQAILKRLRATPLPPLTYVVSVLTSTVLVELHHPRKAGHHALVGLAAGIAERQQARIERGVRVAEERGIVACRAQLTREIGMPVVERRAVADRAMIVRVESRQQRGARGPTG